MKSMVVIIALSSILVASNSVAQEADFRPENRTEISLKDLPNHVRTVLDSEEYDRWKVINVYRSNKHEKEGPDARYLIRLQSEKEFKDVYLDGAGVIQEPD